MLSYTAAPTDRDVVVLLDARQMRYLNPRVGAQPGRLGAYLAARTHPGRTVAEVVVAGTAPGRAPAAGARLRIIAAPAHRGDKAIDQLLAQELYSLTSGPAPAGIVLMSCEEELTPVVERAARVTSVHLVTAGGDQSPWPDLPCLRLPTRAQEREAPRTR